MSRARDQQLFTVSEVATPECIMHSHANAVLPLVNQEEWHPFISCIQSLPHSLCYVFFLFIASLTTVYKVKSFVSFVFTADVYCTMSYELYEFARLYDTAGID